MYNIVIIVGLYLIKWQISNIWILTKSQRQIEIWFQGSDNRSLRSRTSMASCRRIAIQFLRFRVADCLYAPRQSVRNKKQWNTKSANWLNSFRFDSK